MLAFEPYDHGPILGGPVGAATIGGVVAAGVSGSQRLTMGAARDHFLGFEAVSGRGERFVAGGKVVKNVTGYDLPKVMAGSWGRLAAITQLTLKVLPRPQALATLIIQGLGDDRAVAAMALAMRSHAEVSAAAHLPASVNAGCALTGIRVQGFEASLDVRCTMLQRSLIEFGKLRRPSDEEASQFWRQVRDVTPLNDGLSLWRINVPPSGASSAVTAIPDSDARWFIDWAGGLVWLTTDCDAAIVRQAAEAAGGHATLIRATEAIRAVSPFQHPPSIGVAALSDRVRRAFDPAGVFETGRFLDAARAD
jgi:glycolate oxidase FAD binding subunit